MTGRRDDLTSLLQPAGSPDLGFHSGVVTSWDADTGSNVIDVAGTQLADVPVLNTGEAIALKAGHVVALLRFKTAYFIMGRVAIPGTEQFAASSVAFGQHGTQPPAGFAVPTVTNGATVCEMTIEGPAWAREALIWSGFHPIVENTTGTKQEVYAAVNVNGAQGQWYGGTVRPGDLGTAPAIRSDLWREDDGFKANPLHIEGRMWALGSFGSSTRNAAGLHAIVVFRGERTSDEDQE